MSSCLKRSSSNSWNWPRSGAKDELAAMLRVIDAQLAAAFVDLGPILVQAATLFANIATAVADVVDGFREREFIYLSDAGGPEARR